MTDIFRHMPRICALITVDPRQHYLGDMRVMVTSPLYAPSETLGFAPFFPVGVKDRAS